MIEEEREEWPALRGEDGGDGMNIEQEKMIVEALPSLYPLREHEEKAIWAVIDALSTAPAEPKRGKCKWCEKLKERNLRIEYYWIDKEGCTASFSEPHVVATGIANYCPNCGAKMEETE